MVKLKERFKKVYLKGLENLKGTHKDILHIDDVHPEKNPAYFGDLIIRILLKGDKRKRIEDIFEDRILNNEDRGRLKKLYLEGKYVGDVSHGIKKIIQLKRFLNLYEDSFCNKDYEE